MTTRSQARKQKELWIIMTYSSNTIHDGISKHSAHSRDAEFSYLKWANNCLP